MYATVPTTAGDIRVRDTGGDGPVLLFVHGAFVDGRLWARVADDLAGAHRCVVPDLPLGAQRTALRDPRDAAVPRVAALVRELMDVLDLRDVTLVGNDTGGAICQLVAAERPERLGRLVLTSCDAFEHFPPPLFKPLGWAAHVPGAATGLAFATRAAAVRRAIFAPIAHRLDGALLADWLRPLADPAIRRDATQVLRSMQASLTLDAAERLRGFDRPALVVWGADDRVFPRRDAHRLAGGLGARVEIVAGSRAFVPVDQPQRLAQLLGAFVAQTAPVAGY